MVTMLRALLNGCVALGATGTVEESIVSHIDQLYPRGLLTMFRRRTDQVYSTLQQVQRRITEQNGGQSDLGEVSPSTQPMPSVTVQPLSQALPSGAMQPTSAAQPPQPFAGIPASRMAPAGNRYVLQVSGELAMTLVVIFLVTMALMFFLGQHFPSSGGAGLEQGLRSNGVNWPAKAQEHRRARRGLSRSNGGPRLRFPASDLPTA